MTCSALAPSCGADPKWVHFRGYCYFFSNTVDTPNEKRTWYDARSYCLQQGSDLVSIHTDDEHRMVTQQVNHNENKTHQVNVCPTRESSIL